MIATTETAILARLAAAMPAAVLLGTFSAVDLSDDSSTPVVGHLRLERINTSGSVTGSAVSYDLIFSFAALVDVYRASPAQQAEAYALIEGAASALVGWEHSPMQYPVLLDGSETGFDGRVLRLSITFALTAIFD